MTGEQRRNLKYGLAFTGPWLVGFLVFMAMPLVMSFYFSLCDYSILNTPSFVGMQNYEELVHDAVYWKSLRITLLYAAVTLPLGTVLALFLAVILNTKLFAQSIFRSIFFIPSLVPLVALAVLWREALRADYGVVNHVIDVLGGPKLNWLENPQLALWGIAMTGMWGIGNSVVIYLASLQDVPRSLYEAAEVDGANPIQKFINITVPTISPVIYFNVVMGCIGTLQVFALPYVMSYGATGVAGGPARSTLFYTMYLFDQAFAYLNMGYASAMAWVMFFIIALATLAAHKISKHYVVTGEANG